MKKVITYDLKVNNAISKKLSDGTYEISLEIDAKRLQVSEDGQEKEIEINEPLFVGLFDDHPKDLRKGMNPIYLKAHQIKGQKTSIKIKVDKLPGLVSIDPYLTRVDRNYVDNIKQID